MTATLRYFTAGDVHAALDYGSLVEALREAIRCRRDRAGAREPYGHRGRRSAAADARVGWRRSRRQDRHRVPAQSRARPCERRGALRADGRHDRPSDRADRWRSVDAAADQRGLGPRVVVPVARPTPGISSSSAPARLRRTWPPRTARSRPIERISVWGRSRAAAERTAAALAAQGLPAEAVADLAKALADADIVSCATTAREPIVRGALVRDGTHVDLVGAFTPQMRESDDDLVARAELFVDTFAGALKEAGDLVQPMAQRRDHARSRARRAGRPRERPASGTSHARRGDAVQVGRHGARGPVRREAGGPPLRARVGRCKMPKNAQRGA